MAQGTGAFAFGSGAMPSDAKANYTLGGKRAEMIQARLDYIAKHGARFLFANQPPPAPGWPRQYREG